MSDHENDMEHAVNCADCRKKLINSIVESLGEVTQNYANNLLDELKIVDEKGLIQGESYSLLAAFLLSITIKILEMNEVSEKHINAMLSETIELATQFSKRAVISDQKPVKGH